MKKIILTISYVCASLVNTSPKTFLDVWFIVMSIATAFGIIPIITN